MIYHAVTLTEPPFLFFLWCLTLEQGGWITIHDLHSPSCHASRNRSSASLPHAERGRDTCWNTGALLSNSLSTAQNFDQIQASRVRRSRCQGNSTSRSSPPQCSGVRGCQAGSSRPEGDIALGLPCPVQPETRLQHRKPSRGQLPPPWAAHHSPSDRSGRSRLSLDHE